MDDPNDTTDRDPAARDVEQIVDDLFGIGRLWARHGLSVGRSALAASAATLRTLADGLGRISDHLEDRPADG